MNAQETHVREASGQIDVTDGAAHDVLATLIRAGESRNGNVYTAEALREAIPLFEGATAFCDHAWPPRPPEVGESAPPYPPNLGGRQRGVGEAYSPQGWGGGGLHRSVRDVVGSYREVRYSEGRVLGVLRLVDSDIARLVEQVVRDRQRGLAVPNVGLSADMVVLLAARADGKKVVQRVLKVNSVDVVFDPAAGGGFEQVLEAETGRVGDGETRRSENAETRREGNAVISNDGRNERGGTRMEDTLDVAREGRTADPGARNPVLGARNPDPDTRNPIPDPRLALCGDLLTARLAASGLPEAARQRVAGQFVGRVYEASELEAALRDMRDLLGSLTGQATVRGVGSGRGQMGLTMRERVQFSADRLFGLDVPESVRESVPHASGLRELFQAAGFDGHLGWEMRQVMEANEVTTSVMANIVGTAMNKRLVKDYAAQPKWWKPIAVETPVRDMKQQERIRLNDFASLATVSENDAYANLAWDDAKETYTPAKRGNIVYVTLETIINDDLRAVQGIPKKLARAAGVTINEFVAGLFTANSGEGATMADTYHVFDATHHQGNLGSAVLDATSFGAAMATIAKTADTASKRMGLAGKWLLIPPELEQTAFSLLYSQLKPGGSYNDANFFQGRAQYVVVPQFSDADDWYLMADPGQVELIEIGYLGGQDAPELLVQDDPAAGTVFSNDAISYKVRWIFGGGWLDYRGAYGAVVE